jgi:isopropylmalate/homocitrate/citramalate synthase
MGMNLPLITEIADYMRSIHFPIPDNYPLVGRDAFTTKAGIHADGLRRGDRIYNIFDTERLLGRAPRVSITDKTGGGRHRGLGE